MRRTILMAALCLPLLASAQYVSKVWSPDNGDGTYTNPVINVDQQSHQNKVTFRDSSHKKAKLV